MARRTVIGLLLLAGLLIGLTCEPDSGTAASVAPPDVTESVGSNHAIPLPRPLSIADIARVSATTASLILVVLTQLQRIGTVRVARDTDDRLRSVLWSRVLARRGPPAPAFG